MPAQALYSVNVFPGNGMQTTFEIGFAGGYLSKDHVKANLRKQGESVGVETPFEWTGDNTIHLETAPAVGELLTVYRDTPRDRPFADFTDGAILNETSLDLNAKQAVFIAAEAIDRGEGSLNAITPRAILVPFGEIAPAFPPRDEVRGRILAVNLAGEIIGLGSSDDNRPILDASMIAFDGQMLAQKLRDMLASLGYSLEQLDKTADAIIKQGQDIIAQGTATEVLDGKLSDLRRDHAELADLVLAIEDLTENQIKTLIATEKSERIDGQNALAAVLAVIGAVSQGNSAFILNLDQVKVSPTESLAERFEHIATEVENARAQIERVDNAWATALAAEASTRETLGATLSDSIGTAIQNEQAARAEALRVEALARSVMGTSIRNDVDATFAATNAELRRVISDAVSAEASSRDQLAATLRGETDSKVSSAVELERQARVEADRATSSILSVMGSSFNNGAAFQLDLQRVLVENGMALGTRLQGIDVTLGGIGATVASEVTARVDAVFGPVASKLDTVETTANNARSAVTTLSEAVGGVMAKAGVSLDVNGYITGWVTNNNGSAGDFTVIADRFRVVTPGYASRTIFEVTPEWVRFTGKLMVDGLVTGNLDGDILVRNGRIIFNNGVVMKVTGLGFGTQGQFLEWFGPSMDVSQCNEQQAIQYLKTNGDAYFGGSLSSGTISNAGRTTLASAIDFTLGAFSSAGRNINYQVSGQASTILQNGTVYEGEANRQPPVPDPFTGSRVTWQARWILDYWTEGFAPVTVFDITENYVSTSLYLYIGQRFQNGEPIPRFQWRHSIGANISRTGTINMGSGDRKFVRLRRIALTNLNNGQPVDVATISAAAIGINTAEQ